MQPNSVRVHKQYCEDGKPPRAPSKDTGTFASSDHRLYWCMLVILVLVNRFLFVVEFLSRTSETREPQIEHAIHGVKQVVVYVLVSPQPNRRKLIRKRRGDRQNTTPHDVFQYVQHMHAKCHAFSTFWNTFRTQQLIVRSLFCARGEHFPHSCTPH